MPQPFNNAVITNSGARLLTGAQAGECAIQFTRIVTGNGTYSEDEKSPANLQAQSGLRSLQNSFPISNIKIISDHAVGMTVLITNQDPVTKEALVTNGYYINEIGLYAKPSGSGDSDEVLYSIAVTSAENGDFMPPYNGYNPVQITQEYFATVDNALEVTIQTGAGAVALVEDLEKLGKEVKGLLDEKQDAEAGKGLSTNDYTTEEKSKLAGISAGANKTTVDSALSSTSTNPVQNKIVKAALDDKGPGIHVGMYPPSDTSKIWVKTDFEV